MTEASPDKLPMLEQIEAHFGKISRQLESLVAAQRKPEFSTGSAEHFDIGDIDSFDIQSMLAPLSRDVGGMTRTTRPSIPDPRLIRKIIRVRQLRARFFDNELFGDPAWDMLLDLTAARAEHKRVSVTSLCIASGVPPTTALRWIAQMVKMGLFVRVEDEADRRRAFVELSDTAARLMSQYFNDMRQFRSLCI